jgi:hypothetical protein
VLIAGKASNKLPANSRKKACNPAGLSYGRLLRLYNFCKAAGQGCMAMASVQYAQFGDLPLQLIAEHALFIKVILSNFHKLLPLQFGILPLQFGILPLQFG